MDRTKARQWLLTFAATAVSTYALDAVATAAGILLVASLLLHGMDQGPVFLFLASTYILWGAGLGANLKANWALIEDTGTSTSVLSKAAYGLVKFRTKNVRAQKIAAALGYICMELAKETPYYTGAIGAALLSDSVTANDAIIFLGGANLGAAVYEYGLARLTRVFLQRRKIDAYVAIKPD